LIVDVIDRESEDNIPVPPQSWLLFPSGISEHSRSLIQLFIHS